MPATLLLAAVAASAPARADGATITVTGQREAHASGRPADTATRLGLSVRETPATIETLTQDDLQLRGLRTSREAFADVVGAVSGNVPGNPAVITLRGFSGGAVSILQDGIRISTSTVVVRDTNSWHFDRFEVLKGPASVLYGEGALAGVVNRVTRKPTLAGDRLDMLLSYGSFGTVRAAGGVNLRLSNKVAVRADASYLRSDSLYDVDGNAIRSAGLTGSLLLTPSAALTVLLAVDHYADRYDSPYQGLPFVPAAVARDPSDALRSTNGLVLDRALRQLNYNPAGATSGANETTLRSRIDLSLGGGWSLANDAQRYVARRDFLLSGDQTFTAPTAAFPNGRFARSAQRILHRQRFWTDRLSLAHDGRVAGLRNRIALGVEYSDTRLVNPRQQAPVGAIAAVDPFAPDVGRFPAGAAIYTATNVVFRSRLRQASAFAEDALNLAPGWLVVVGGRYDHVDLDREVTDLNARGAVTRANPRYDPFSWRAGTTLDVSKALTLYAQYTTAVVPVSSVLLQSIANTAFRLTTGRSVESGFKLSALGGRLTASGAAYRIAQDDILTRDPVDPTRTVQGGRQSSRGVELSVAALPTPRLRLEAGASYTRARYDALLELVGGVRFDRAGKRPINVPRATLNAAGFYAVAETPLTLGAIVRRVSGFYTDTANGYFVRGRTTLDASLGWRVSPAATLTLRGRNLTQAFYGEYSGYPVTNVYIAAPRSVELALATQL